MLKLHLLAGLTCIPSVVQMCSEENDSILNVDDVFMKKHGLYSVLVQTVWHWTAMNLYFDRWISIC